MRPRRLPIRARLTLAFVAGLAVVLAALSGFVYVRTSDNLLETIDAGLRSRAEVLSAEVRAHGPTLPPVEPTLLENDEAFAQITDRQGRVLESSAIVATAPLVPPSQVASLRAPAWFDRHAESIDNVTRVLAVPVRSSAGTFVVLVGASLQDRRDQVLQLGATLAIAGTVLLTVGGFGAWWLVGAALRPVERMRRQAMAISAAGPAERLSVPAGADEIGLLAATLNDMLARIEEAVARERRVIDRASHELRTPLAIQRMDLDLALSGPQTVEELASAVRAASEENQHLTRLAEDLLVLSRVREGELPVDRRPTSLRTLITEAAARNEPRASERGIRIRASAPDLIAHLDPSRVRQALDDLIDNALRVTPPGGSIDLKAGSDPDEVWIAIEDSGPGFAEAFLPRAFEPFTRMGDHEDPGAGLGLAIVRSIVEAHGGKARAENTGRGARVTLTFSDADLRSPAVGEPLRADPLDPTR